MERYQVKSLGSEPFELIKENSVLATLNYPSLYNTLKAEIKIANQSDVLVLKSPGIWKKNLELWNSTQCLLSSKLGWNLSVTIRIQETDYQLKVKSLLDGIFILQDTNENVLVKIDASMDWAYAKADFGIQVFDKTELFTPEVLLFLIHNCNYFLALSGNGSATEGMLAAMVA
ncbi:hypothetical protein [Emticicia soli]|uniref:Uncharacterized protein n=1 Tax=Emticicia soli TaxID=2027878 RepID=A0ABW5JFH9_9BACT